eukprot:6204849-Pleurochrysis_carterae.AAC.1
MHPLTHLSSRARVAAGSRRGGRHGRHCVSHREGDAEIDIGDVARTGAEQNKTRCMHTLRAYGTCAHRAMTLSAGLSSPCSLVAPFTVAVRSAL